MNRTETIRRRALIRKEVGTRCDRGAGGECPRRTREAPAAYRAALLIIAVGLTGAPAQAQERPPIIDMHLHAWPARWEAGGAPINPITGRASTAVTGAELIPRTLEIMERLNIVLGVAGGDLGAVRQWVEQASGRIVGSLMFPVVIPGTTPPAFPLEQARQALKAGEVGAIGEITAVYAGLAPDDPALEPFYALAEEFDVPVGIHMGPGRPGIAYHPCCAGHRSALSSPLLLEEVLVRHPKLRVWVMHAGYPAADEMIALLWGHPRVHVDIGVLNWALPRAEFHAYLERIVRAGFTDRILFGSDQMFWPEVIETAVEAVESVPFLSERQKRDIFYHNAARFLRLEPPRDGGLGGSGEAPTEAAPGTGRASREVVLSLYDALNRDRGDTPLAEHAVGVVEKHFAKAFVGHGGPENHDYDLEGFKQIIRTQFRRFPGLRNSVEDVITEGTKTLVRIRLFDGEREVRYMALYRVEAGWIVERWSFGDRNFR